jgi:ABC-type lipoprotein release transport system permease subunit
MSPRRLILLSLAHHWRLNAAVGLGVTAAAAVLTGALLVGDSVRGSLRDLTLDRLGRIDQVLLANRFFREELAGELAQSVAFQSDFSAAVPLILLQGSVESATGDEHARAGQVTIVGCDERFWQLGQAPQPPELAAGEVILNETLARELAVAAGDEVLLRFPRGSAVPEESALGRKTDTVETRRVTVQAIIPAEGLGRFGLQPNQQLPRNAYVRTAMLQTALDQRGRVNALFVAGQRVEQPASEQAAESLQESLRPTLDDYGLSLELVTLMDAQGQYFNLTSQRMILEESAVDAATQAFGADGAQPAFTYLANYITAGEDAKAKIPYSTATAIDFASRPPLGPFVDLDGQPVQPLAEGEIALNRWAVEDMAAQDVKLQPGDGVKLTFFEPESAHGTTRERTITLKFKTAVDLTGAANDPHFTPEVKGVTDQESINDWDPPFEFDASRVRSRPPNDQDEKYWDEYQATPKAFVSLKTGRDLWRSRFGQTTSIRIPARDGLTKETIVSRLQLDPRQMGFTFQAVKRQGLAAAAGTTPFNLLFLGFSMFIIAAAVMLVALLFRLGCEQRANEVGILEAVGLRQAQVRNLLGTEGLIVAAIGGLAGTTLGVGYAWLMLAALRSPDWWLAAVSTPFLHLHVTPQSLIIGYLSGVLVSLAAIAAAVWRMGRQSVRSLLANQPNAGIALRDRPARWSRWIVGICLPMAVVLGAAALGLSGEAQAGAFFGAGAMVLAACLAWLWQRLKSGATGALITAGGFALTQLAARNGARNPARSTLTIGLVAAATFLIVAISAFRLDPPSDAVRKSSGTGGFTLVAQSEPLFHDLNTAAGRAELGIAGAKAEAIAKARIIGLRVQPGDDASCLNLYQTSRPRVVGVSEEMIDRGGFAWAGSLAESAPQRENPWLLLRNSPSGNSSVPAVLDANTAMYSLHKGLGDTIDLLDERGQSYQARIVGLLKNSILQGEVIVAESEFLLLYPGSNGQRMFLIETSLAEMPAVEQALENSLGDFGFDVERSADRLAAFMAVQNTYLTTFQSLGGLGLLLGTFGLATVQLRNVLERRGELALLRAAGFRRARLALLVMLENAALLVGGLGVGILAALVAILPHLLAGGAAIPWGTLAATLSLVLLVGLAAGTSAVRATLRAPLLPALRGE